MLRLAEKVMDQSKKTSEVGGVIKKPGTHDEAKRRENKYTTTMCATSALESEEEEDIRRMKRRSRLFGKIRSALKPTAVPSVFAVGPFPDDEQAGASNAPPAAKRIRLQEGDVDMSCWTFRDMEIIA
ncbi:unnamed protein product [Boreogadus saida]